jgi:hypothetical protein
MLKVSQLTSDNLPSRVKIRVKEAARLEVTKLLEEKKIFDEDVYDKLLKKISRRAIRLAVRNMQAEKFELLVNFEIGSSTKDILPKT